MPGVKRGPRNKLLTGSQSRLDPQLISLSLENLIANYKFSFSPKALFDSHWQYAFSFDLFPAHVTNPSHLVTKAELCAALSSRDGVQLPNAIITAFLGAGNIHLVPPASTSHQTTANCRNCIYTHTINTSACQHSS